MKNPLYPKGLYWKEAKDELGWLGVCILGLVFLAIIVPICLLKRAVSR